MVLLFPSRARSNIPGSACFKCYYFTDDLIEGRGSDRCVSWCSWGGWRGLEGGAPLQPRQSHPVPLGLRGASVLGAQLSGTDRAWRAAPHRRPPPPPATPSARPPPPPTVPTGNPETRRHPRRSPQQPTQPPRPSQPPGVAWARAGEGRGWGGGVVAAREGADDH